MIAAVFCLRNTNEDVLEVALQQSGTPAAKAAAHRALAADKHNAGGVIRIHVREVEASTEHAVFLGAEVPFSLLTRAAPAPLRFLCNSQNVLSHVSFPAP
jgi:hypothetical protein